MEKVSKLKQSECLNRRKHQNSETDKKNLTCIYFITGYNDAHNEIYDALKKNWFILCKDPYLKNVLPKHPIL